MDGRSSTKRESPAKDLINGLSSPIDSDSDPGRLTPHATSAIWLVLPARDSSSRQKEQPAAHHFVVNRKYFVAMVEVQQPRGLVEWSLMDQWSAVARGRINLHINTVVVCMTHCSFHTLRRSRGQLNDLLSIQLVAVRMNNQINLSPARWEATAKTHLSLLATDRSESGNLGRRNRIGPKFCQQLIMRRPAH